MVKLFQPNSCPHCPPQEKIVPGHDDPRCICFKPMSIYIPAGQHLHCPVHPEFRIESSEPICSSQIVNTSSQTTTLDSRFDGHSNMNVYDDGHKTIC